MLSRFARLSSASLGFKYTSLREISSTNYAGAEEPLKTFGLQVPVATLLVVLATLLAALIGGFFLLHVHKQNAYRFASVKFRAAVLDALSGLYPLPSSWPNDTLAIEPMLRAIFPRLQAAIAEFRPFVPWYCRRAFDRAWLRYRSATEREIDYQCYLHYIPFHGNPDPEQTLKNNVDALLSFAKHT